MSWFNYFGKTKTSMPVVNPPREYDGEPDDIVVGFPVAPPPRNTPRLIVKLYSKEHVYLNTRGDLYSCCGEINKAKIISSSILKFANDYVKDIAAIDDSKLTLAVKLNCFGSDVIRNKLFIDGLSTSEINEMVIELNKLIELE